MSVKSWQRRFETLVVPLLDSAETLWNEIGVSEDQREKVLQRSASEQRNFFENIVAEAKLLRDRLQQENALLENELKSLGSELKLLIPSRPARLTLSESHEWLSREVEHVQVERARRNRQFLVQFSEYTFLRGLLDERGDSTLLEAYRDCVTSRSRVVSDADTRKLSELVAALREERAVRASEFEALRTAVKNTATVLDLSSTDQHHNSGCDDVEELLSDEFVRDLLAFDVRSIRDPNFEDFVSKRLADANSNRLVDEPYTYNDGNATVSFLRREQSITIGDELQTLPYLAAANLYTLRDARDRLTVAVNSNRERNNVLRRAIETIWDRLDVPADVRSQLVDTVGGVSVWQAISVLPDPSKGEPQVGSGIASFRVRSALESALRELESAKRAQIPRIVQRIRVDLAARWSALNLDAAAELAGLNSYITEVCGLPDVRHIRPGVSEAELITQWCSAVRPDLLLEAHERAEAGWSEWFSHTERVHERIARWIDVFKRLVFCETDARRDPDFSTNRGGFILKLQKEVASMRKELGTLERAIGTLITEYEQTRQATLHRDASTAVSFGEQLLLTRTVLVSGKQFTDFAAEQFELLEAAKREFAASTKKGGAATVANPNATNVAGKTALLRLDVIAEVNNIQQGAPTTPKKRGANGASSASATPKRGRLAASTVNLAPQSQISSTTITMNHNTTATSHSTGSSASRTNLLALPKANLVAQQSHFSGSSSNLFRTHVKSANPATNQTRIPNAFNNSKLLSRSQMPLGGARGNATSSQSTNRPASKQQLSSRLPLPISRLNAGRSKLPTYNNSNTNAQSNQAAYVVPRSPSPDGGQRTIRVQEQRAKALNSKRRSRSFSDLRTLQIEPMHVDEMTIVQESSLDSLGNTPLDAGVMQHSIGVGITPTGLTRSGLGQRTNADGLMQRIRAAPSTSTLASTSSGIGSSAGVPSANVTAFGAGVFHFAGRANAGVQTSITSENTSAFGDDRSSMTNGTAEDCSFVGSHGANSTKIEETLGMRSGDSSVLNVHNGQPSPPNAFTFALAPRGNSGSSFLI